MRENLLTQLVLNFFNFSVRDYFLHLKWVWIFYVFFGLTHAFAAASYIPSIFDSSKSTYNYIQHLRSQGHLEAAKQIGLKHIKRYPEDVDVMLLLGFIYKNQKDYPHAILYFNQVLKKTKTYLDARIGLIDVAIATNQLKTASTLVNEGLRFHPNHIELLKKKANIRTQSTAQTLSKPAANVLYQIKALRIKKKFGLAKKIAFKHLRAYPNDVDVLLLLGLIYKDQHDYHKARIYLNRVLKLVPTYKDAKLGLAAINLQIKKKKVSLRAPSYLDRIIFQVDTYLAKKQDLLALSFINQAIKMNPNEAQLWVKKGEIQQILYQYPLAAYDYKQALLLDPNHKQANQLLTEVSKISPYYLKGLNEIGVKSSNAYVSDLHSIWDYSSAYYSRDTDYGLVTGQVNVASRLGTQAPQFEFKFSPRLNRHVYFDLMAAVANQPILFPKRVFGAEMNIDNPQFLNISFGGKYNDIGPTYFSTYTGSLNRYVDKYWFSFRPYYFVPKDKKTSLLYTGVIRRYFNTTDHYLNLVVGSGKSPDLADLITVNFIVIKNSFINLDYQFPLLNHALLLDIGAGYERWQYPSHLIRNLYNTTLGIKHRF